MFDLIRDLFAQTPDAKAKGYAKGRFSFNVKGGHADAYPVNDGQPGTAVLVKPLHGLVLIVR